MADDLKNIVSGDFANNPEFASIFAGKQPGDECEFTLKVVLNEINDKGFKAGIKKITSEYDEEKKAEPTAENPVSVTVMAMPGGKSGEAYG